MSRDKEAIVRELFAAYNAGGIEALLPLTHPDVVTYPISDWVENPVYRGQDGVRKLFAWVDDFDELHWELHEIRESKDRVLVHADLTGRIRATGAPIRQPFGAVCSDFRDGMVGEWRWFRTWQEALEAVGLEQ